MGDKMDVSSKIGMSLDDLAKKEKGTRKSGGRGGSRGGRGGRGGRGRGRGGRDNSDRPRGPRRDRTNSYESGKQFNRRRSESGRADDGPWQHDKFGSEGRTNEQRNNTNARSRPRGEGRVKITNLHYTVMEQDLQRLVADIGGLISCKVFFDDAGRSKGEAELVFTTLQQAKSAIERYNESSVEGLKMQMQLGEAPVVKRPRSSSDSDRRGGFRRLGGRDSRDGDRRGGFRRLGGGRGGRTGGRGGSRGGRRFGGGRRGDDDNVRISVRV